MENWHPVLMSLAVYPANWLVVIIVLIVRFNQPKEINGLYGYRTSRSMSSQKLWDAAQRYSNNVMLISFSLATFLQIALAFFLPIEHQIWIQVALLVVLCIMLLVLTERYLKRLEN